CENCEALLQGPFCHQCGQPEKTPVRDIVALSTDAFDYLFDVDSRLYKTLRDLFLRPGRLTQAYLQGKRMSFVRPMRIYLAMSALLFVVVGSVTEMDVNVDQTGEVQINVVEPPAGDTPADPATAPADATPAPPPAAPAAPAPGQAAPEAAKPAPDAAKPAPAVEAEAPAPDSAQSADADDEDDIDLTLFGNQPWHRTENPLVVPGLPDFANERVNDYIALAKANLKLAKEDPKRLGHSFLRVLPQSLFVLLPIFALLLKLVLVFKRRLYMEHLMVAVHSHTFLYMGVVLAIVLSEIAERWPAGWTNPWWTLMGLAIAWIPLNLYLTQKRVYRQGWFGAMISYGIIGTLYIMLFSFTALGALVMSLVNL
ncbi:MAG: DUF3667 domain-containing protein, partial [Lysobacterales bacterium]